LDDSPIKIIGAGLAGCEAAWASAKKGLKVRLHEARPKWFSPAHRSENFAELVCSNSLKSDEEGHATALLKEEMRALGSIVMEAADATRVPAGKALAVDRDGFSGYITEKISSHPNIEIVREEVKQVASYESQATIIATGPLTSPALAESIASLFSSTYALTHSRTHALYFYDAIAPIIEADSLDMNVAFRGSRYDVGTNEDGDYLNCPFTKEEYDLFIDELLKAEKIMAHGLDDIKCFEGCMPVEVMAERHKDALRHGPMKPMGFADPRTGRRPYAIVQLRQDDLHATLFNMVGFQTRMTYKEQDRVLRLIPGLKEAKFARYGSMHRNTYINGPTFLNEGLELKDHPGIFLAGQITGVEGYLESAAIGLYIGSTCALTHPSTSSLDKLGTSLKACSCAHPLIPPTTAIGALINHIINSDPKHYIPMNCIWGIFPPLEAHPSTSKGPRKAGRKKLLLARARSDFQTWLHHLT